MPRQKLGKYDTVKRIAKTKPSARKLSDETVTAIIEDYYKHNLTAKPICKKYQLSESRFYRIINKYKDAGIAMSAFDEQEVLHRAELPELDRLKKLCTDATQVLEMTLAVAKKHLESSLRPGKVNTIELDKLSRFFREAAPYVMERKDGKNVKEKTNTPRSNALQMFKNQSKAV